MNGPEVQEQVIIQTGLQLDPRATPTGHPQMLTVTNAACVLLSEMMAELQPTEGKVVRIVTSVPGLSIELGEIQPDDRVFHHETRMVLAVAENVARESQRLILNAVATTRGLDLRVTADRDLSHFASFSVTST